MLIDPKKNTHWLESVLTNLQYVGYCVLTNVVNLKVIEEARERLYVVREKILQDIGQQKLDRAGEIGVLRLIMKYDAFFLQFLEIPELLTIVDNTVSETAILHLQNGFINQPISQDVKQVFQYRFHRDFPRILNGYPASINIFISLTDFTHDNGATRVIPGSQQKNFMPSEEYMRDNSIALECPAGSLLIFDSTLLHAAGKNISSDERIGINHQFTRSYIKQQIDYVRAIDKDIRIESLPARTQQLLGYYTRVVTSLDEYYLPEEERLYRKNQG